MTDWKKAKRARNAAGWEHVSGYAKSEDAPEIRKKLKTAAEVDAEINEGKGDEAT